jgi:hypothetical protein
LDVFALLGESTIPEKTCLQIFGTKIKKQSHLRKYV